MKQASYEVNDPEAIRLLLREGAVQALAPFFGQARTLSQGAAQLGWKLPRLSAWVNRLLDAGLLRVEGTQARRGSALKYYRTVAPVLHVPYRVLGSEPFDIFREKMNAELEAKLDWGLRRVYGEASGAWGYRIEGHPGGGTSVAEFRESEGPRPPAARLWTDLRLSETEARDLHTRFLALLDEFAGRQQGQRYLLRFGFAPLDDE